MAVVASPYAPTKQASAPTSPQRAGFSLINDSRMTEGGGGRPAIGGASAPSPTPTILTPPPTVTGDPRPPTLPPAGDPPPSAPTGDPPPRTTGGSGQVSTTPTVTPPPVTPPPGGTMTTPPVNTGGQTTGGPAPVYTEPSANGGLMSGVKDFRADFNEGNKDATTRGVGASELSSNQLNDIISGNSKYIKSARQNAGVAAADRGMLMSSVAVGAGEKAAIDAAQPFAMQQADVYNRAAVDNMAALNVDAQADQGQFRQAAGQQQGIEAQSIEAGRTRQFTSVENATNRAWQSTESAADRAARATESAADREQRSAEMAADREFQTGMAATERDWRSTEAASDREILLQREEAAARENRQNAYFSLIGQRESSLSQILNGIYSNTNLKPAEQQAAVNNAIALNRSIANSYNSVFSQGIPDIFADPYSMGGGGP